MMECILQSSFFSKCKSEGKKEDLVKPCEKLLKNEKRKNISEKKNSKDYNNPLDFI